MWDKHVNNKMNIIFSSGIYQIIYPNGSYFLIPMSNENIFIYLFITETPEGKIIKTIFRSS